MGHSEETCSLYYIAAGYVNVRARNEVACTTPLIGILPMGQQKLEPSRLENKLWST